MRRSLIVLSMLLAAPALAQRPIPEIPFESVPDFFKLPPNVNFGEIAAVATNSRGHVFVLSRSNISGPAYGALATQILEFDEDGNYLRELAPRLYAWSYGHGIRVDADDNVWVADKGSNMVVRVNLQGHVTLVLGRKGEASETGSLPTEFHLPEAIRPEMDGPPVHQDNLFREPSDVAWDSEGNIYVSDGYINSRVAKFDRDGNWVKGWGSRGDGPGEFYTLHNIGVDANDNVYVADRTNGRIQVFDSDGAFLREIKLDVPVPPGSRPPIGNIPDPLPTTGLNIPGTPWTICITPGSPQYLYTSDAMPGRVYKLTLDGQIVGMLGKSGKRLGEFGWVHGIACPSENELYVADLLNWRVQKLVLHPQR